ncbi:GYDIA family GHMP kinase [Flavobacteriaceae sp. LMIT009]|jgi:mevalonate kinase
MAKFYSHGKLLLTGEYLVLDGAKALAIPTKFGQSLEVNSNSSKNIAWKSFDHQGKVWFENTFSFDAKKHLSSDDSIPNRLIDIFNAIKELNPNILKQGYSFKSELEFPQDWGLGSSSTLLNNLASWAEINSFELLENTFGGSGYDIACAENSSPITYQLDNKKRTVSHVSFAPGFSDSLYFVHLNQKQNSREGIATYTSKKGDISQEIDKINKITDAVINCSSLEEFNSLIEKHEQIISNVIDQETVKNRLFSDFKGSIKSLGAWGGDFILITSNDNPIPYFENKGYQTIIPYKEMVLN